MKILLFGRTGLLGKALFNEALSQGIECVSPTHQECDITKKNDVLQAISSSNPDIVINATGYTRVDDAESHPEDAFLLNSTAVANLVEVLKDKHIPLVHFSTDYVFDGKKAGGYTENDLPSPLSVYGKSKAAAEETITKNLTNYFIVRTSWLFGPGGKNFVDTMLALAEKGQAEITVVNDQFGCPTYTPDLAKAVFALIKTPQYGMYHIVNSGSVSWFNYAVKIFHMLGIPLNVVPISAESLKRPARRPLTSVLLNTKLPQLRSYEEALTEYLMDKQIIL